MTKKFKLTPAQRFLQMVENNDANKCWFWVGCTNGHYGLFRLEDKLVKAHRYSYELHNDHKIPEGLVIDHLCRNTVCVNPSHLEPVTNRENCLRGMAGEINGKRQKAKKHGDYPLTTGN